MVGAGGCFTNGGVSLRPRSRLGRPQATGPLQDQRGPTRNPARSEARCGPRSLPWLLRGPGPLSAVLSEARGLPGGLGRLGGMGPRGFRAAGGELSVTWLASRPAGCGQDLLRLGPPDRLPTILAYAAYCLQSALLRTITGRLSPQARGHGLGMGKWAVDQPSRERKAELALPFPFPSPRVPLALLLPSPSHSPSPSPSPRACPSFCPAIRPAQPSPAPSRSLNSLY